MQRYEAYKPSGVEWLGDIPENWDVCRNIGLFDERKEINRPDMELLSVTINRGVIRQEEIAEKKDSSNEDKSKYKVVRKDDLAYNKMRMWQGAIGRSEYEGIVSPAYVILAPRDNLYSRYYHYLYRTEAFIAEANRHSYGLCLDMNSLRYEDFKTIYSPVPPRTEVERIVAFLDQKTAEIDAAIAKKERLIELLDEQKSILINSLVTKGVNPQVVTKASGLSWGGDIPAHWKIRYLKHLFRETDARTSTGEEPLFSLRMSGQLLRHNDVSDKPITPDQLIGYKIVSPGQLVMNRMRASMGLFAVAHERGLVSPDYAVFNCIDDISQAYFLALFRNSAIRGVFLTESKGLGTGSSGFLRLYSDRFGGIKVPCPPREEQEKIVLAINDHFLKFADVERSVKIEIEKLVVMRSILIADAVTGKMRV